MSEFHSFLWLSNIPVCVCVYTHHIFFIHLSVDGHLGCFYFLAIVNSAAINIRVHGSFQISVFIFFWYKPRSGIAGSYMLVLFLVLWGTSMLFSIVTYQFTFPPTDYKGSLFSTSLPTFVTCRLFFFFKSLWDPL